MSYIQESLADGEVLVARARFHWLYSLVAWLALVFLGIFVIGAVIFLILMIRKWSIEIGVTGQRVLEKRGLFFPRIHDIALDGIDGIQVRQGFLGRFLDFGTVRIESADGDAMTTPNIADPAGFVQAIETAKAETRAPSSRQRTPRHRPRGAETAP